MSRMEESALRLIGLWTEPSNTDAFEQQYLGAHLELVRQLPHALSTTSSRCLDGQYYRLTEVTFGSLEDLHGALESPFGQRVIDAARKLEEVHGIQLHVLLVGDPG